MSLTFSLSSVKGGMVRQCFQLGLQRVVQGRKRARDRWKWSQNTFKNTIHKHSLVAEYDFNNAQRDISDTHEIIIIHNCLKTNQIWMEEVAGGTECQNLLVHPRMLGV